MHWDRLPRQTVVVSHIGDIQDPFGHNPVQCALGWPCSSKEVGPDDPLQPFSLCDSMVCIRGCRIWQPSGGETATAPCPRCPQQQGWACIPLPAGRYAHTVWHVHLETWKTTWSNMGRGTHTGTNSTRSLVVPLWLIRMKTFFCVLTHAPTYLSKCGPSPVAQLGQGSCGSCRGWDRGPCWPHGAAGAPLRLGLLLLSWCICYQLYIILGTGI